MVDVATRTQRGEWTGDVHSFTTVAEDVNQLCKMDTCFFRVRIVCAYVEDNGGDGGGKRNQDFGDFLKESGCGCTRKTFCYCVFKADMLYY